MVKIRIKTGDKVQVITGKDKGKRGIVIKVLASLSRVIVKGINLARKHVKANKNDVSGGIINKELPIHISNVAYVDSSSNLITKITYTKLDDKRKVRVSKRSGEILQ
ncbi:50S ribosomal protein L24 [Orientia tsutsugamushi]|uniref:Large ribosomal subunit protein uL24 n=1 Tax=Orientia tsutsugamushi (strain Boryong) TaxID=357244 RepID=RL24_ORITB|nr:50S ribosomal protein L24 [Orientia tsutsugamushi]A5CCK1.1 RecName: Full=Large ribosomal subunit protein uL24; AltName: Full=50S ribosomal protein L24 [Orientia tsutsugamushi str. Boryong]CAM79431.1 50S ribosomal protein L24 [Orientia tsutsugamushi str. Boryong]